MNDARNDMITLGKTVDEIKGKIMNLAEQYEEEYMINSPRFAPF
jgi:hypothetical protein